MRLKKYTEEQIKQEAELFLSGKNLKQISTELGIPYSTVSWHLIYPLKQIDYPKWVAIRTRLYHYAKSYERVIDEAQYLFLKKFMFKGEQTDEESES